MKKKGKQYLALALTVAVATPVVATNVIPTIIVMAAPGPYATERVSAPGQAIDGRIAVDVGFAVVKSTEINANNTEITVEFEREISDTVKNTIKAEIVRDDQTSQHKLEESGTLVSADMIPGSSGKWKGVKVRIDPRDYHNDEQIGIKVHSTISGVTMKFVLGIPINQLSGKAVVMPSEGDSQLKISIRNPINSSPYDYIYEYGFGTSGDSVVFQPATVGNIAGSSSGEATITLDLPNNDRVPVGKKAYIKVISKYSDNRYLASTIGDIQSETQATQPTQPTTTQSTTAQPTQPTTAQSTTAQPTQPTTTQPTQPTTARPTQPTPTQPTTAQPTQPITARPTQPTPTQPTTAQPTQPTTAQSTTAQPTQPTTTQPTQPTTARPTQPTPTQPMQPITAQPTQPTLTLPPTQPTTAQPTQPPTQPTPTQPTLTLPPTQSTTVQPTQPTTARPTQPTPTQPTQPPVSTQPTTAQPRQPMQPPVSTQTPTQPTTAGLTHPTEPIDPRVTTTLPNKQVATPTDARRRTTGGGSSNPGGSSTSTRRSRVVPEPNTGLTTTNFTRVPEEVPTEPKQFEKSLKTDADTLLGDPVIRRTTAEPPSEHSRPRKTVTDLDTGISQRASSSTNRGYTTEKTKEKTKEKENKVVPKTADVAPLSTSATAIFTSIVGLFTAGKLRKKKQGEE